MKKSYILPCSLLALVATFPSAAWAQSGDSVVPSPVVWNPDGLVHGDLYAGRLYLPQYQTDPRQRVVFYLSLSHLIFQQEAHKLVEGKYTIEQVKELIRRHELDNLAILNAFTAYGRDSYGHGGAGHMIDVYNGAKKYSQDFFKVPAAGKKPILDTAVKPLSDYQDQYLKNFQEQYSTGAQFSGPMGTEKNYPGFWKTIILPAIWYAANADALVLAPFDANHGSDFDEAVTPARRPADRPQPYLNNARNRMIGLYRMFPVYVLA